MIELKPHQLEALPKIKRGSVLRGGTGSGKSRTALAYFYQKYGGDLNAPLNFSLNLPDLYIITEAAVRDKHKWETAELFVFQFYTDPELHEYCNKVVIDSWNNISKYKRVTNAFFIFDEQRAVGWGKWAQTMVRIAHQNDWIMLSATPGDCWKDYMALFIAHGWYINKTDFDQQHVIYKRGPSFPIIQGYYNEKLLERYRDDILVDMRFERDTVPHHETVWVEYDKDAFKTAWKTRWNPDTNSPFLDAAGLWAWLRRLVNSDISRVVAVQEIFEKHPKIIIFYNTDYELEILRKIPWGENVEVGEWNGHVHTPVPTGDSWVYLVNYMAGAKGWECTTTDTIIFYSANYSWSQMEQAAGRIDRMNTPFVDLYYYHLRSHAGTDNAVEKAIQRKKKFTQRNINKLVRWEK